MINIVISLVLCVICVIWNLNTDDDFQRAVSLSLSMIFAMVFLCELHSLSPSAMDLHAGKAVIKCEVVDGVKVDSTFVFKD